MQLGEPGKRTRDLLITRRPALPPELQPPPSYPILCGPAATGLQLSLPWTPFEESQHWLHTWTSIYSSRAALLRRRKTVTQLIKKVVKRVCCGSGGVVIGFIAARVWVCGQTGGRTGRMEDAWMKVEFGKRKDPLLSFYLDISHRLFKHLCTRSTNMFPRIIHTCFIFMCLFGD